MPERYVFSSKNFTNVWAGIGARMWAVSQLDGLAAESRKTKARRMRIGSLGVLYCTEAGSLTTPFIVYSEPDFDSSVTNIWPETWVLPFRIHPLGTPNRLLPNAQAMQVLPTLKNDGRKNISHILPMQGTTAFVPKDISDDDWEIIIKELADKAP